MAEKIVKDSQGLAKELVNDCISRQAAIEAIDSVLVEDESCKVWFRLALQKLPSAQPEQKKGKWEYHSNPNIRGGMNPEDAYCSVCGFHIYTPEVDDFDDYNFCPNCGADMRGEQDDESRSNSNAQTDTRARGLGPTDKSSGI